jgi:UDP-N-acetylglucosamine:LPS N-acetylglucosamine transferase
MLRRVCIARAESQLDSASAFAQETPLPMSRPIVAAIDMGYGHLRPAAALAGYLGTEVLRMDLPPLGDERDRSFWERTRTAYEPLTRFSQLPGIGPPLRALLHTLTSIERPWPARDLSGETAGTRWMRRAAAGGAGKTLAKHLLTTGAPLLATFYAAPILAELHGARGLYCVVTDSDVNRVWAPPEPRRSGIVYFCPSERSRRRLISYGVAQGGARMTGYPLPHELVGGRDRPELKRNLAARLSRLRVRGMLRELAERELGPLPEPDAAPLIVFAVGGAGAQVPLARALVRGMAPQIKRGELRLALVAGRRPEVASALRDAAHDAGLPELEILEDQDVFSYFRRFNALLARSDALFSKPSEMTFFAALGLPLIAAPPVGVHEEWNLRWAADRGAALSQHDPAFAGEWLLEWLEDGVLSGAALNGFLRLPQLGLYDICDQVMPG